MKKSKFIEMMMKSMNISSTRRPIVENKSSSTRRSLEVAVRKKPLWPMTLATRTQLMLRNSLL